MARIEIYDKDDKVTKTFSINDKRLLEVLDALQKEEEDQKPNDAEVVEENDKKAKFMEDCAKAGFTEKACQDSWELFLARQGKDVAQRSVEDKIVHDTEKPTQKGNVAKLITGPLYDLFLESQKARKHIANNPPVVDDVIARNPVLKRFDVLNANMTKIDSQTVTDLAKHKRLEDEDFWKNAPVHKRSTVPQPVKKIEHPLDFDLATMAVTPIETLLSKMGYKFVTE